MDSATFQTVYAAPGPFATVLVDVSHDETGEHAHALRVRAACEQLGEQGADEAVVKRLADHLGELVRQPSPVARLVVANAEGVLYDEVVAKQVDRTVATWAPLPDLAHWVEHVDTRVDFVLALVDHAGGDVAVMHSDVPEPQDERSITGETEHVHKVPTGGWSALRYQRETENVWAQNAELVAAEITKRVREGHGLVLLAGDPRSKALVREALGDLPMDLVDLESGTRAEDGGGEAMQQAVREVLMDEIVGRRVEWVHELRERLGRGESVATGVRDVAAAFVRGQVETLLLDPAASAELELAPAQHPGLVLSPATPVEEPVRADLALVAAAAHTDAAVSVLPSRVMGGAPVAALLRWNQPSG